MSGRIVFVMCLAVAVGIFLINSRRDSEIGLNSEEKSSEILPTDRGQLDDEIDFDFTGPSVLPISDHETGMSLRDDIFPGAESTAVDDDALEEILERIRPLEYRLVTVDSDKLRLAIQAAEVDLDTSISFTLSSGEPVTSDVLEAKYHSDGPFVGHSQWTGAIGGGGRAVLIVTPSGDVNGNIYVADKIFEIEKVPESDAHIILMKDQSLFKSID